MFESLEKRKPRKSAVQPVLALAVHAALISLALRGVPAVPTDAIRSTTLPPLIFVPTLPSLGGSPLPGGTHGDPPVSVPPIDMSPNLPPLTQFVPGSRALTDHFDPRPYLKLGTPDTTGISGATVLTESDLTDPPRALHLAEPRYPEALRQAGIEGSVIVTYIVDAAGHVEPTSMRIVSSDHPAFAEAVLASVGTAQFTPGRLHGQAVRVLVRQSIRFATRS